LANPRALIEDWYATAVQGVVEVYSPRMALIYASIGLLEEQNLDPSNHFFLPEGRHVNFYERRDKYVADQDKAIAEIETERSARLAEVEAVENEIDEAEEDEMEKEFWDTVYAIVQQIVREGFELTIGDFKMKYDPAKPLGGEGSVFHDAREQVFVALKIDPESPLGKFVKDPINSTVDNLDAELEVLKENMDRELTKAKEDLDKELTKAKSDLDRELSKAKKDLDAELTRWRKGAEDLIGNLGRALGGILPKL